MDASTLNLGNEGKAWLGHTVGSTGVDPLLYTGHHPASIKESTRLAYLACPGTGNSSHFHNLDYRQPGSLLEWYRDVQGLTRFSHCGGNHWIHRAGSIRNSIHTPLATQNKSIFLRKGLTTKLDGQRPVCATDEDGRSSAEIRYSHGYVDQPWSRFLITVDLRLNRQAR